MISLERFEVYRLILVSFLLVAFFCNGCVKNIPYSDDQLAAFHARSENVQLIFTTNKGRQVAFYIPPQANPEQIPAKISILYPGIHSVALGWLNFLRLEDDPEAGYLLVDYPGRGLSEGIMHPEENYKNSEGALAALANHFGVEAISAEISVMGHSFGSGSALQFALRHKVKRIVLIAPYNTLSQAVAVRSKFLAFIMPAEIDNLNQVRTLLSRTSPPEITIVHGAKDTTLPVHMGRELAEVDPNAITYHEIPKGDHTTILTTHRDLIFNALLFGNGYAFHRQMKSIDDDRPANKI